MGIALDIWVLKYIKQAGGSRKNIRMLKFTQAAQQNIDETGINPENDIAGIRSGVLTYNLLLVHCLNGASDDRVQGWKEYVETVCEIAECS